MNGGWLTGFGHDPRPRAPRATPEPPKAASKSGPLTTWRPGQARVVVEVACCPKCGHERVKIRTPRGENLVLLVCRSCGNEWKDERCDRLA